MAAVGRTKGNHTQSRRLQATGLFQHSHRDTHPADSSTLDTQYATLQHQWKQPHTKDEDDEMDGGLPDLRGQRKGEGKHAAQRRQ